MVISLSAKGLTHGEICAHLAEVYGAEVSKQTITAITDRVMEGLADWQNRPLDPVYAVIFIDAINVKIREGQVANRPIYLALGVTVDGERDVLGLSASTATARARNTGCGSCQKSRTAVCGTCACWSATASKACLMRSAPSSGEDDRANMYRPSFAEFVQVRLKA